MSVSIKKKAFSKKFN